jgi:DNA sulfur modification protein DndD
VKLIELKLRNFRQYYGEQTVAFADDRHKNVTIINGNNGAGKTGLYLALQWCLYGAVDEVTKAGELVSKKLLSEMETGTSAEFGVVVEFVHLAHRYRAVRTQRVTKGPHGNASYGEPNLNLTKVSHSGKAEIVRFPEMEMESILPAKVRNYFFFDGEKIDEFSKPDHAAEVGKAIRNVLSVEALQRAINHLSTVSRELNRELTTKASGRLQDLLDEQVRCLDELELAKKQLAENQEELHAAKSQFDDINQRLESLSEVREWAAKRSGTERLRASKEEARDREESRLQETLNNAYLAFASEPASIALRIIEDKREKGQIPSGFREQFIEDLMSSRVCICGREFEHGGDEYRHLVELLTLAVPGKLQDLVTETGPELKGLIDTCSHYPNRINGSVARISEINAELDEIAEELREISRHISETPVEDITALEHSRKQYEDAIQRLILDQGEYNASIKRLSTEREDLSVKIKAESAREDKAAKIKKSFQLAEDCSKVLREIFDQFAETTRREIEKAAKQIFAEMVWKNEQFVDLQLTENYELQITDRWGYPTQSEMSAGERQVLSLAFIAGMSDWLGTDYSAPLVMDTPFGRLFSGHRESVARTLPELTPQLVLLVQDEEFGATAREAIADHVGAEYELVFDDSTGTTAIRKLDSNQGVA